MALPAHRTKNTMIAAPSHAPSDGLRARLGFTGPTLALVLAATGAVLATVDLIPRGSFAERILDAVLPLSPIEPPAFDASFSVITFVALAIGLRRGKRASWELAVLVFGAAAFAQGVLLHHLIAGVIAAGCLVVLVANPAHYSIRIGRPGRGSLP